MDDILAVFTTDRHVNLFKRRLEHSSVLKFTHESMTDNTFHSSDVKLTIDDMGNITTSVYIKPNDKGVHTNYLSHMPDTYKKSIIKTLMISAIKYSSNWLTFNSEFDRIKQVLVNNNFPLYLIDTLVQRSLSKHLTPSDVLSNDPITFYVLLNNLHNETR